MSKKCIKKRNKKNKQYKRFSAKINTTAKKAQREPNQQQCNR